MTAYLVGSFVWIMEEIGLQREFHTLTAERPLREYIRETLSLLATRPRWSLREIVTTAGATHSWKHTPMFV